MNCDELQQLTAIRALGALDGPELDPLRERLARDAAARAELTRFLEVATALAGALPKVRPSADVRARVMQKIAQRPQQARAAADSAPRPSAAEGIRFVMSDAPWMPSPLPNSRFKLLSAGPNQDYIMLLIELGPGARYPEHVHAGPEEMMVLTGDLQTEGRSLGPGDFLHAEPGSHHQELHSIEGCTAIMVVPKEALAELGQA